MQELQFKKAVKNLELITGFDSIDPNSTYSIFIRHGDRNKIPTGEFGNEIELNETGIKRSLEYGKSLSNFHINKIFTSPVKRCVQTAEMIKKGTTRDVPIEESILLGNPGAFVIDKVKAGKMYLEFGFEKIYYCLLNNIKVEGNRDIKEGAKILTRFMIHNSTSNGINIYVSHDMIIALYAFTTFGKEFTLGDNWVKYLGGLIIKHIPINE